MAGRTKRQHVLSRFYLRGFAKGDQLVRVPADGGSPHLISINDATVVRDFYSVEGDDGEVSDYFERAFARVEEQAAPALSAILGGEWPLSASQKQSLSAWLALQYLRTEAIRAGQTEIGATLIRLLVGISGKNALRAHIQKAEGQTISESRLEAEWADLTKPGGPELRPDVRTHIRSIIDLTPPTAAMIADRQWSLHTFERKALVTCDSPVTLVPYADHPEFLGVGLANAEGFTVPISRKHGLAIMAPDYPYPDLRVPGSTVAAKAFNAQASVTLRKAAFCHPDDVGLFRDLELRPRLREVEVSADDHFIKEEGFFGGLDPSQLSHFRSPGDSGNGVSLADLPWPIPGRRFVWSDPRQ